MDQATLPTIPEATADSDPIALFQAWMQAAARSEPNDPNAMCLATSTPDGAPSARMVLLKGVDDRGFVFYTNLHSRKGEELAANPRAALLFHWKTLQRQVRVEGLIEPVGAAEADDYFASRARISRLGAHASDQSRMLPARAVLEERLQALERRFATDAIPRPPHWSGFRVAPARMEFWRDMPFRLHDRAVFTRAAGGWTVHKLFP